MAINTISYADKSDINTSTAPVQNKVSASDLNEIKSIVNANANLQGDLTTLNTTDKISIVGAVNEVLGDINYNLETDGDEVLTGRFVDNRPEYVKRYSFQNINSEGTFSKSLGFSLDAVTITDSGGTTYSNSANWFPFPMGDWGNSQNYGIRYYLNDANDTIQIITANANFSKAYVNLYYTYN